MPGPSRTRQRSLLLGLAACLIPEAAEAHTGLTGIGSFWAGVAHLLTSLDQLAFLLGLAIWTSFYDRRFDARVIAAAFGAACIGVFLGVRLGAAARLDMAAALASLMVVCGPARRLRLPAWAGSLP